MVFRLFDTLGYKKEKKIDKYPLVPALRDLYSKYKNMEFEDYSEEEKANNLEALINTIREDSKLKHLVGLSGRTAIYKYGMDGPVIHMDNEGKFEYYDCVIAGSHVEYEKQMKNLDNSFLKNFFKDPNKLKEGILDYIKKSLYTHYD